MYLSKKKILKAMRLAAGSEPEALEIVRYVEECGVHVVPRAGHPLLDEIEESFFDGPLMQALERDMREEHDDGFVDRLMANVRLSPKRALFGKREPWHFPIPELAKEQIPILAYRSHRDFALRHPECPWVTDMRRNRLWSPGMLLSTDALSVSPVACSEEWRGLSLLYCAAGIKWTNEVVEEFQSSPRLSTEAARVADESLSDHALLMVFTRMALMVEKAILGQSQLFLGLDQPPARLIESKWTEDDRELERDFKKLNISGGEALAILFTTLAGRQRQPLSTTEGTTRHEMFGEIARQSSEEKDLPPDHPMRPAMPIGSC